METRINESVLNAKGNVLCWTVPSIHLGKHYTSSLSFFFLLVHRYIYFIRESGNLINLPLMEQL